jgi:hypothetical protein
VCARAQSHRGAGRLDQRGAGSLRAQARRFVNHADDLNSSDMDLCEWRGQTVIFFNVGEQHYDNALALALSPLPLDAFLHALEPNTTQ